VTHIFFGLFVVFFIITCFLSYVSYRFARMLISFEDNAQKSVEELETCVEDLNAILEIPVFADSNEVKKAINVIKKSRETVIFAITSLTGKEIKPELQNENLVNSLQQGLLSFNSSPSSNTPEKSE